MPWRSGRGAVYSRVNAGRLRSSKLTHGDPPGFFPAQTSKVADGTAKSSLCSPGITDGDDVQRPDCGWAFPWGIDREGRDKRGDGFGCPMSFGAERGAGNRMQWE